MNRGIVYIAFGKEYDKCAAHTIAYSRQYTTLPITVLTNLDEPCEKWNVVKDIKFIKIDGADDDSRAVRTQLIKYTPYDKTLFIDCDSVIRRNGIEKVFELFGDNDAIFQQHTVWEREQKFYKVYRQAVKLFECEFPFRVCMGGFFAFKKNMACEKLFEMWYDFWKRHGVGRDMPALSCAIQKSGIRYTVITRNEHKLFSFGMNSDAIILHRIRFNDLNKYGIPLYMHNINFDIGNRWFWDMVYFDEEKDILDDPFIKLKFNREKRIEENRIYIDRYLQEMHGGGLKLLDIACGPGELLELAKELDCEAIGIDNYDKMLMRDIDEKYNKITKLSIETNKLKVINCDMNEILNSQYLLSEIKIDIINCKHAINFIAKKCFDWKMQSGCEYKRNGEWIIGDEFQKFFVTYFSWCTLHLHRRGVVLISALNAKNSKDYSNEIISIAERNGFKCEMTSGNIVHKFRLSNG